MEFIRRKIPQELFSDSVTLESFMGQSLSFPIGTAVNKKILLTPHPQVNPERLMSVISMTTKDLLASHLKDPMTCWILEETSKEGRYRRKVAVARGNHRSAVHYYNRPATFQVTGIAMFKPNGDLEYGRGEFDPAIVLYPYNIFLANIKAQMARM